MSKNRVDFSPEENYSRKRNNRSDNFLMLLFAPCKSAFPLNNMNLFSAPAASILNAHLNEQVIRSAWKYELEKNTSIVIIDAGAIINNAFNGYSHLFLGNFFRVMSILVTFVGDVWKSSTSYESHQYNLVLPNYQQQRYRCWLYRHLVVTNSCHHIVVCKYSSIITFRFLSRWSQCRFQLLARYWSDRRHSETKNKLSNNFHIQVI